MKKILLSLFVMGAFLIYVYSLQHNASSYAVVPTTETNKNNSANITKNNIVNDTANNTDTNTNPNTSANTNTANNIVSDVSNIFNPQKPAVTPKKTVAKTSGMYTDGTYTGNSADAYYGYIKVQAIIKNGKLANVIFLDHPQDRNNSIRINNYAMPVLKQEAIRAQSSNVDTVSGASFSSGAFRESLADALSQARV